MFTRISWLVLLSSGLVLFAASLYLEAIVLDAFLPSAFAAFAVAAALEGAKVVTIVLNRYLRVTAPELGKRRSWFFNALFRLGLVLFSALCSLMFLSAQINAPKLEQVREADISHLKQQHQQQRHALSLNAKNHFLALELRLEKQHKAATALLNRHHLQHINQLENDLSAEMNNSVQGEFIGPRYRAIEKRLNNAKSDFATAYGALIKQQNQRLNESLNTAAKQHQQDLLALQHTFEGQLTHLRKDTYNADSRIEHPLVHHFLTVAAAVLPSQPSPMQFTWVFALGLSLLMELGIMITFDTLMLAWLPVFSAAHKADVAAQSRKVNNDQKLREEVMDDNFSRDRLRAKRQHVEQSLDDALDDLVVDAPSA